MHMQEKLPSAIPDGEPLPEGLMWLLLTGEVGSDSWPGLTSQTPGHASSNVAGSGGLLRAQAWAVIQKEPASNPLSQSGHDALGSSFLGSGLFRAVSVSLSAR